MVSLIDPLEVKRLTLRNRIVLPPMQTSLATKQGTVTDKLVDYYVQRSRAIGLLIVEHSYVSLDGKLSEKQLGIHDDGLIYALEKLTSRVHAESTPIVIQINHGGRVTSRDLTGSLPLAPSATENARELRVEELDGLAETYASAALRAIKAGFDGVEVHGAHGFLLNQFYSPLTNNRTDEYGGTLENRIKFPLEVVEKVRKVLGNRLLLYRIGSVDLDPAGTQIADSKKFAIKLEESGVDIIDVSGGVCGSRPAQLQDTQGYFIPQAQQIKEVVNIPVIGVGGITDPDYADKAIQNGKIDLVAVGRNLLKNPYWAEEAIKQLRVSE
jgi:2,4-dienoyl-CoA reductase-like NADH-dependent reductase (Old Yellow Enzyme family)